VVVNSTLTFLHSSIRGDDDVSTGPGNVIIKHLTQASGTFDINAWVISGFFYLLCLRLSILVCRLPNSGQNSAIHINDMSIDEIRSP